MFQRLHYHIIYSTKYGYALSKCTYLFVTFTTGYVLCILPYLLFNTTLLQDQQCQQKQLFHLFAALFSYSGFGLVVAVVVIHSFCLKYTLYRIAEIQANLNCAVELVNNTFRTKHTYYTKDCLLFSNCITILSYAIGMH